jgi:hypothetical protein
MSEDGESNEEVEKWGEDLVVRFFFPFPFVIVLSVLTLCVCWASRRCWTSGDKTKTGLPRFSHFFFFLVEQMRKKAVPFACAGLSASFWCLYC